MVRQARLYHEFTPAEFEPVADQLGTLLEENRLRRLADVYRAGEIIAASFEAASRRIPQPLPGDDEKRFAHHIATAIRIPVAEVMAWWLVVIRWDRKTFDELCANPNVTVAHLVQIAPIDDFGYRQRMLERVTQENLRADKVRKAVRAWQTRRRRRWEQQEMGPGESQEASSTNRSDSSGEETPDVSVPSIKPATGDTMTTNTPPPRSQSPRPSLVGEILCIKYFCLM